MGSSSSKPSKSSSSNSRSKARSKSKSNSGGLKHDGFKADAKYAYAKHVTGDVTKETQRLKTKKGKRWELE
jgi:hypothetical protein